MTTVLHSYLHEKQKLAEEGMRRWEEKPSQKERLKNSYTMMSSSPIICNCVKVIWEATEFN